MARKSGDSEESGVKNIIEQYLALREDISGPLKQVLKPLYKGETHTVSEWDGIIKRRLERPA